MDTRKKADKTEQTSRVTWTSKCCCNTWCRHRLCSSRAAPVALKTNWCTSYLSVKRRKSVYQVLSNRFRSPDEQQETLAKRNLLKAALIQCWQTINLCLWCNKSETGLTNRNLLAVQPTRSRSKKCSSNRWMQRSRLPARFWTLTSFIKVIGRPQQVSNLIWPSTKPPSHNKATR